MNPLAHQMVGSFLANARDYNLRERRLVMLASLAPDLDGALMFIPGFAKYHHTFSHNVFYCLAVSAGFALYNRSRRLELFLMCSFASVLQILIDVITNHYSWRQQFLRPLTSYDFTLENLTGANDLTVLKVYIIQTVLVALCFFGTWLLWKKRGRTFLEFYSPRLDKLITDFIRLGLSARCAECGARAFYEDLNTGVPLCGRHARVRRDLTVVRREPSPGGGRRGS